MGAEAALAFVARREGTSSMPADRWAHVMSLELGWMSPGEAKRYVTACRDAGMLAPEGDALQLTFDEDAVDIPRHLRPDPDELPAARDAPSDAARKDDAHGTRGKPTAAGEHGFEAWAKRLAEHQGRGLGDVLDDVAALQERMGGLLHAEAAVLRLMAEAGLDIRDEAAAALERLRLQGGAAGSAR